MQLSHQPDVIIVDGQGLDHPRRFCIANHFSVLTGIPTIVCVKLLLFGRADLGNLSHPVMRTIYSN